MTDRELLVQIVTRQERIREDLAALIVSVAQASTKADLDNLRMETQTNMHQIEAATDALVTRFVTREEFDPVRRIVYGVVGVILTAVVVALIGMVVGGVTP